MNKITFPLKLRMKGAEVGYLQNVLQVALERDVLAQGDDAARATYLAALKAERDKSTYGQSTHKLVALFQSLRRLPASGEVDEKTAQELNALLWEWESEDPPASRTQYVVTGEVRREDGRPFPKVAVHAIHEAASGPILVGTERADAMGRYTIRYESLPGVAAIDLRVDAVGERGRTLSSSAVIRKAKRLEIVMLDVPVGQASAKKCRIEGRILLEHGLPAEKLRLRLYRREFGGAVTKLDETTTLAGGAYAFAYDSGGKVASLEVRAVDGAKEVPLSAPLNDLKVETTSTLNLVAPGALQPLAAEYQRLSDALKPHVGQLSKLADAKENNERQDLTVLHRATGWDARLIALAATSERLSADPEVRLPQGPLYGLLRAGLPSEKRLLAQFEPETVEEAIKTVRDSGIVSIDDQGIATFKKQFSVFANKARLALPAPGSRSTYGDFLNASGLAPNKRAKFASVYLSQQGDPAQLWDRVRKEAGLEDREIAKLQLQGKVALLAGNSQVMTARLLDKKISDPAQLVEQDFGHAKTWVKEIFALAGVPENHRDNLTEDEKKKLDVVIPPAYTGEKIEQRLDAYANDMARKLRLSYSTHQVARTIETDNNDMFKLAGAKNATVKLLKSATAQGFRLGRTPVEAFLKSHTGVMAGMADGDVQSARLNMRTLQRVYQITPSDEAMPVLLQLGIASAYDVMAYSESDFVQLYLAAYLRHYTWAATEYEARLVYRKARQVTGVTYNLFAVTKKLDSDPQMYAVSASAAVRDTVRDELVKHFPTMESLFGSMDFCECEHCRSVLSPAAYLVDLLQFVDAEEAVWENFQAKWKETHGGTEYTARYRKPYDVLIERRPDLVHIPLTCENTHTAMPYVDIVNEILEYYVANDGLDAAAAQDTGNATTEELLAEPRNVIQEAYKTLSETRYPLSLPFDLWIETVREFCSHYELPLQRLLEVLRKDDKLFDAAQPTDRFRVFMESLHLSPAEIAIFTDPRPLDAWWKLYGYDTLAEATTEATNAETKQRIDLHSAKALSRRLGVTYKELVEIALAGFVNPALANSVILHKLGIVPRDVRFYFAHKALLGQDPASLSQEDRARQLEVQAFRSRLEAAAERFNVQMAELEADLQAIPFSKILVLADPDAGCDFDQTILRHADDSSAQGIEFLRINLFVRLWRKLGWTVEETDRALQAFMPKNAPYESAHLAKRPLQSALTYLAHLKALDDKIRSGKQSRLQLLSLWSAIASNGQKSLYEQLFLSPGSLTIDAAVFDDVRGRYLENGPKVELQLLALQGPLGLTAEDIRLVLENAGTTPAAADLSLDLVSQLYRHGLLAKALKVSVRELLALKELSGRDPFKNLHPDPLQNLEDDCPFTQTLRFIEIAEEVKKSGLSVEDLEYLLRHKFDETGKYRPDPDGQLQFLKNLAEGVRAIQAAHAMPADPGAVGDEDLSRLLGLALPSDVVEQLLSMMNGTAEFTAAKSEVPAANALKADMFDSDARIRFLSYQEVPHQEQKLTLHGVLFAAQKNELEAEFGPMLTAAQRAVFSALIDGVLNASKEFFETHLQKRPQPDIRPAYGFLDAGDFALLFTPDPAGLDETQRRERMRKRRTRLVEAFLPFLQQQLIRQFVVQTVAAQTGAEAAMAESLLTDARLISAPGTLLEAVAALSESGASVSFHAAADGSGPAIATATIDDADTGSKDADGAQLRPAGAQSARMAGYLQVATPGAYRFQITLDKQGAEADLRFDHLPNPLFLTGAAGADGDILGTEPEKYLELKAGVPYSFSLRLRKLGVGEARMSVQGEVLPAGRVGRLTLYPETAMKGAKRAIIRLSKALQLVEGLGLSEREIRYFLTHRADFDNLDLGKLPSSAAEYASVTARALFQQFLRLSAYVQLKRDLAAGTDDLLEIFEADGIGDVNKVYSLVAKLTRRDEATVRDCANALFAAPKFSAEKPLVRLWDLLQVVERFGVPIASISGWLSIADTAATPEARFEVARDLKESLKARVEPESWRRIAQPIFNRLRRRQRDALVSHVLQKLKLDRLEKLYEHFLIDPGMEPVVQTSRIRLALASLQLFIQRCLLNLELNVHPTALVNAKHWEWMKRYRVWEANRKIFLFPENWLEPEFRDDKTHLFSELEGALLEGDVSSDLVEDAFLNYLRKLDELARLDIVAMHLEDDADLARRTLHVIGRTHNLPGNYFYRRLANRMWTPWEPIALQIESDHLAPVVWRDRLYLFWVTFMDKPDDDPQLGNETSGDDLADVKVSELMNDVMAAGGKKQIDVQLQWAEYFEGEWSTQQAGEFVPVMGLAFAGFSKIVLNGAITSVPIFLSKPIRVLTSFDPATVFVHVTKSHDGEGNELGVSIHLKGPESFVFSFYLAGRNSEPERTGYVKEPTNPYSAQARMATRYAGRNALGVVFNQRVSSDPNELPTVATQEILKATNYTILPCNNDIHMGEDLKEITSLLKPVFFQDRTRSLFLEPSVTERRIEEWQDWVTRTPLPEPEWRRRELWEGFRLRPEIPWKVPVPEDPLGDKIHPGSLINPVPDIDWLINPETAYLFDDALIGSSGSLDVEIRTAGADKTAPDLRAHIKVNAGSALAADSTVVLKQQSAFQEGTLAIATRGLNIVGRTGFNLTLGQQISRPGNGGLDEMQIGAPGAGR